MGQRRFDFTVSREPVVFGMGGVDYSAPPVIDSTTLGKLLEKAAEVESIDLGRGDRAALDRVSALLAEMFGLLLDEPSARAVAARITGTDDPLDLRREVVPTIRALAEVYTERPTQPSWPSAESPPDVGTSSTGGAPPPGSTPGTFPPPVPAT